MRFQASCSSKRPEPLCSGTASQQELPTRIDMLSTEVSEKLGKAVNRQRLLDTAERLVAVPSPTGTAGNAADCRRRCWQAKDSPSSVPSPGIRRRRPSSCVLTADGPAALYNSMGI